MNETVGKIKIFYDTTIALPANIYSLAFDRSNLALAISTPILYAIQHVFSYIHYLYLQIYRVN